MQVATDWNDYLDYEKVLHPIDIKLLYIFRKRKFFSALYLGMSFGQDEIMVFDPLNVKRARTSRMTIEGVRDFLPASE